MNVGSKATLPIFGYEDYRRYLADYYRMRKNRRQSFSYRQFSREAGISSPNFLQSVITGERRLGRFTVEKFLNALQLEGNAADYFRILVRLEKAEDQEREDLLRRLKSLTPQDRGRKIGKDDLVFFDNWLQPLLRALIELPDYRHDPYWISRRLLRDFSVRDISRGLEFLRDHEFIKKSEDGEVQLNDENIWLDEQLPKEFLQRFGMQLCGWLEQCIRGDVESVQTFDNFFSLPKRHLPELHSRIKDFYSRTFTWIKEVSEQEQGEGSQVVSQLSHFIVQHTK